MMIRQVIIQIANVKMRNVLDHARLMVNGYSIVAKRCVEVWVCPQEPQPNAYYKTYYVAMDDMNYESRNTIFVSSNHWPNIKMA